MATLYLDRSGLELRSDGAALALYENGERLRTVPLNLLERVVMQGSIKLDTGLLAQLGEAGIAVVMLSARRSRRVGFLLGAPHRDGAIRLAQYELALERTVCAKWASRLVLGKARAQRRVLTRGLEARPDCRKPLFDAMGSLDAAIARLRGSQFELESLRGIEGACAAAYFGGFSALFADALGFSDAIGGRRETR